MSEHHHSKVLIIGAGPAGYTAAIYAARANLQPILVQGLQPGGQLTITTDVENYPGFADVIQGPWLMEQMQQQAEHVGTQIILDMIVEVDLSRRPVRRHRRFRRHLRRRHRRSSATGAQARWLGLPSEETFRGFGVSACATCDGFFFRDKEVVVVGGGNTAVEEALYLTNHASRGHADPSPRHAARREDPAGPAVPQSRRSRSSGTASSRRSSASRARREVTGVRLRNVKTGAVSELACDGVFVAIGHTPVTELVRAASSRSTPRATS